MVKLSFLDGPQQGKLAGLLEGCRCMNDKRERDQVIRKLGSDVRSQIQSEGSASIVVPEMVRVCSDYPDNIELLIRAVAAIERNSIPMGHLWDRLPDALGFSDPDIHGTISHVLEFLTAEKVPRKAMEAAFQASISAEKRRELELPAVHLMCRWRLLREAESLFQRPDGTFPFADFIRRLLPGISDKEISKSLACWAAHLTGEPEKSFRKPAKSAKLSAPEKASPPHLILRLFPNPSDRYKVVFYLHQEGACRGFDDAELPPEAIGESLDSFLHQRIDRDAPPRAVEVMAPVDNIMALKPPPHLWPLKAGRRRGTPLGKQYPVYLRLDRNEIPLDLRDEWNRKWSRFQETPSPSESTHWECDPSACSWETLEPKLDRTNGRPCLMLGFEPAADADWFLDVLHDLSIPVALWGNGDRADIEALIDGGSLRDLPALIRDQRKDTSAENQDLPHRLSLLWDNPEREILDQRSEDRKTNYFDDSTI